MGGILLILSALGFAIISAALAVALKYIEDNSALYFFAIGSAVSIAIAPPIMLVFIVGFYRMCYIVADGELTLKWWFIKVKIKLQEIVSIQVQDIGLVGVRMGIGMPGYRFGVFYLPDIGRVTLFSTSMLHDIMIIETASNKYGVTPSDPEGFMKALRANGFSKTFTESPR